MVTLYEGHWLHPYELTHLTQITAARKHLIKQNRCVTSGVEGVGRLNVQATAPPSNPHTRTHTLHAHTHPICAGWVWMCVCEKRTCPALPGRKKCREPLVSCGRVEVESGRVRERE